MHAYRLLVAITGGFAIALQYYLVMVGEAGPNPLSRTINLFSYFTILSNSLVVLAMLLPSSAPSRSITQFFARPSVRTGILSYILIVSTVYFFALRHLWHPQGWQFIADTMLHYGVPLLYAFDWILFVQKGTLRAKHALEWLIFPSAYAVWIFAYGAMTSFYPYPFVDVPALGYAAVLFNIAVLLIVFVIVGMALIALDRMLRARTTV